jgi:hypothetical protein
MYYIDESCSDVMRDKATLQPVDSANIHQFHQFPLGCTPAAATADMASIYYGGHHAVYGPYFNAAASRYYGHPRATASDALISGDLGLGSSSTTPAAGIYPQPRQLSFSPFSTDGSGCWDSISAAAAAAAAASAVQKRSPHPSVLSSSPSCVGSNAELEPIVSSLMPYHSAMLCGEDFQIHSRQQQQQQQQPPLKQQPKHCLQQPLRHQSSFSVPQRHSSDHMLSPCGQILRCSSSSSYHPLSTSPPSIYCPTDAPVTDAAQSATLQACVPFDGGDVCWTTSALGGRSRNGDGHSVESASTCRYAGGSVVHDVSKSHARSISKLYVEISRKVIWAIKYGCCFSILIITQSCLTIANMSKYIMGTSRTVQWCAYVCIITQLIVIYTALYSAYIAR